MKLLNAQQIKELDQFSITSQKIKSHELMERAAKACTERISALISSERVIDVFCGRGNNGGDGLAIARLLLEKKYKVNVYLLKSETELSADAAHNKQRLADINKNVIHEIDSTDQVKTDDSNVAVDAILGTGINKSPSGLIADTIDLINTNYKDIISIDVPSGLFIDQSSVNNKSIVKSSLCLTFHVPKLAFLLPGNSAFVPEFEILDIGLDQQHHSDLPSQYYYLTHADIRSLLKPRTKFSHKGTYGHALLFAGSQGKSGAAIIASKACMRSGAGLLTLHSTKNTLHLLGVHLPEAISSPDPFELHITESPDLSDFDALAFGPGVGTANDTAQILKKILNFFAGKILIDADGLNILSENKTWLSFLPAGSILTPHPKEFERLTEKTTDDFERLKILKQFSLKYNCIVVLKGAHTAIAMPDGNIFFNSSGNAGLAKAGSGDGLSGIILGLMARGYNPPQAALIGTFVHGLAADLCAKKMSMESMLISDVIECLPEAFRLLEGD